MSMLSDAVIVLCDLLTRTTHYKKTKEKKGTHEYLGRGIR